MGRNWIAMLLLGGVAVFFMGCEKEGLGEPGELVPVHFSLSGEDYGGAQVRNGGVGGASETVIVPLDDKYCIYATLAEDTAAQLRDFEEITNKRVMIVVFEGTTMIASQEYRVDNSNGDIVPVSPPGISVPSNVTYTFVAYSINTADAMATYTDPLVMGPDADLLWGSEPDVFVGPGGVSLTIGMRHKFSQVTVKASLTSIPAGATLGTPSGVTITPGYQGSLDVRSGVMTKSGTSAARAVSSWTGASPVFSAAPLRVYTYGERPVSVTIGSVTVGSVTYSNKVAKFDIALLEGYKYTLTADLKKVVEWAGSNIYWDSSGQKLTFDAPTTDVGTYSTQRKQGVLFKWGSLIGISPAPQGDLESIYNGQYNENIGYHDYGTNTTLYTNTNDWGDWTTTTSQYMGWYDIPTTSISNGESLSDDKYNTDGMGVWGVGSSWEKHRGDICRYISENGGGPGGSTNKYRMPTRAEMGEKSSYSYGSDGWTKSDYLNYSWSYLNGTLSAADGTYLRDGYVTNSNGGIIFPASGYRYEDSYNSVPLLGILMYPDTQGYYWNGDGYLQTICIKYGGISFGNYSGMAASVRCVRAN